MMEGSESFLKSLCRGIHLDSGSTFPLDTGKHIKPGTERKLSQPFHYGSNIGSRDITMEGESMVFEGSMKKIDPQAKASVESLSQLVTDGYHVLFDSERYNGFIVNKDGKSWRFPETNGLYTFTRRENEAEYHWTDDKGLALWWGQKRRVMVVKDLYALEQDKASAYLLDREDRLYKMIEHDLTVGNPSNWVEDMIGPVRSGRSQMNRIQMLRQSEEIVLIIISCLPVILRCKNRWKRTKRDSQKDKLNMQIAHEVDTTWRVHQT